MTLETTKKMQLDSYSLLVRVTTWVWGCVEAFLVVRLLSRLLAARPDNPVIDALYKITDPLIWPLIFLDTEQPRFGAVLELSTLVLTIVIPILGYALWRLGHRSSSNSATAKPNSTS
jgi:TctA family transporter